MKFSKHTAAGLSLPEGKREHFEWDDDLPGFGVRMRRGDANRTSSTWVVQGRLNGLTRRESLGDVRRITLDDARTAARKWFAKIELGVDPAAQRKDAKAKAAAIKLTLGAVADRYLDFKQGTMRPSTYKAAKTYLTERWKPLRSRPIDSIKKADIAARLQELIKENGRTSAARARDYLRGMFAWAMREGLCETNPTIATNDPAEGIPARDRVLGDDEVRTIWKACRDDDFGRIVRLLLLTGCRREEIAGLRWDEVNLDTGMLKIPGERTKNHSTLELALAPLPLEILESVPRRIDRDYVFGGGGKGGFSGFSYSTIALNGRIIEAEGKALARWTLHDLRRTFRTGLGKLGVAPHIAELCINHVKGGVEGIYDRYKYASEMKAAWALWADHVRSIVDGAERKVVALQRRKA
jgi:integrase